MTALRQLALLLRIWRRWRRAPYLRLGQLVGNAAWVSFPFHRVEPTVDLHHIEDEQLVRAIERYPEAL